MSEWENFKRINDKHLVFRIRSAGSLCMNARV